jgi:potassium/hydrogen antiporter
VGASLGIDAAVLFGSGLLVAAVLTAAVAARTGSRFRVPGALLFLGLGMLVGDDGLGLGVFGPDDADLVRNIGAAALLLILFEGGLTTKPTDLRIAALPGGLLASVGVVITAAVTALGVWLLLDVDVLTAALLGAVVASTDAAAVFSVMRTTPLPRKVAALLRLESGANDPVAIMLTVGLIALIDNGGVGATDWAVFALVQLLGGGLVGLSIGWLGARLLGKVELGIEGLYPIVALGIGGIAYGIAALLGASGFFAVYLAGLVIGGMVPRHRRSIRSFHEAAANASEVGLFLLLGLLVFPSQLLQVAAPALLVAGVLILVARPLAVVLCSLGSKLTWQEQAVVSWGGLRGAVPIVLATFPLTAGIEGAALMFDVVFFVVLVSVLVQGSTLLPLIRRVHLDAEPPAWSPVAEALPLDGIDVDLVEVFVSKDLPICDRTLEELPSLEASLVAAIVRGNRVLIPTGSTRLHAGDVLLLTSQREAGAVDRFTAWARGEPPPQPGREGRRARGADGRPSTPTEGSGTRAEPLSTRPDAATSGPPAPPPPEEGEEDGSGGPDR